MASNIRFLYTDLVRNTADADITGSTEASGFPVENVKNEKITARWRTTDLTDETAAFDRASAVSTNCVAIINHNLNDFTSVTPTVTFEGDDAATFDSDGGNPQTIETLTVVSGIIVKYFAATTARRYWRIKMTGGSGTETYYTIGRLMFGTYFQPARTIGSGMYSRGRVDFGKTSRSIGGQTHSDLQSLIDVIGLGFTEMETTDRDNLDAMFDAVHTSKPILLTVDTTDTTSINDTTRYGKLTQLATWESTVRTATLNRFNASIQFSQEI